MNGITSKRRATQLAISLVNQPGMLARICRALAAAKINIHALSVVDVWGENSTVRLVVNEPGRAAETLREIGITAMETEVLIVATGNKPGALADIAERLAAADVNIEYAYVSGEEGSATLSIILRPSEVDKGFEVLT